MKKKPVFVIKESADGSIGIVEAAGVRALMGYMWIWLKKGQERKKIW